MCMSKSHILFVADLLVLGLAKLVVSLVIPATHRVLSHFYLLFNSSLIFVSVFEKTQRVCKGVGTSKRRCDQNYQGRI